MFTNFMKRKFSLKSKKDIEKLLRIKKSVGNKCYAIYFTESNDLKIAISVSKKLGNAVTRNYQKRVTREILRKHMHNFKKLHALIIVKKQALDINYVEKEKQLKYLITKVNKI